MATQAQAHLRAYLSVTGIPNSPLTGALEAVLEKDTNGTRWTNGTGSGQIDRIYLRERTALGSGATDSYNLLAAGALTDIHGQAIDADELKALIIYPTAGSIRIDAPAANFIGIFNDATDLLNIPSHGLVFNWGESGLDVTTNGSFDITETTGAATASYVLCCIVAQ